MLGPSYALSCMQGLGCWLAIYMYDLWESIPPQQCWALVFGDGVSSSGSLYISLGMIAFLEYASTERL